MKYTRYIIERASDGSIRDLLRFREDDTGIWSEYLDNGDWVYHGPSIDILEDLHNPVYCEITEEEAAKIAQSLGGSI
jgi:hypothetical protein